MIPKKYRGQVYIDIAAFTVLAFILIIYYGITKPYSYSIIRKAKKY